MKSVQRAICKKRKRHSQRGLAGGGREGITALISGRETPRKLGPLCRESWKPGTCQPWGPWRSRSPGWEKHIASHQRIVLQLAENIRRSWDAARWVCLRTNAKGRLCWRGARWPPRSSRSSVGRVCSLCPATYLLVKGSILAILGIFKVAVNFNLFV